MRLEVHMASSAVSLLRFISVSLAAAALTLGSVGAGTLDAVKQAKTIRLAVRDDAPPFSYKDRTGQPAGFMVDLCRAASRGRPQPRRGQDRLHACDRCRPLRRHPERQGGPFV